MCLPNRYGWNIIPTLIQSLLLQEGQIYASASLIIQADLVYDILPPVLGIPSGPKDFEITGQTLNPLN
jgi:hypothetical protein